MAGWIVVASSLACGILFVLLLRARRQLRTSRGAFETLTRQAPVGIVTADSEGQCTFANDAWCEISGLTIEETLGQGWSRAVHPDDLAAVLVKWNESVQTRRTYRNELRVVRPDGKLRHVLTTIRPTYDATDKFLNFIGTVIDVTEQHMAQAKAQENETLLQTIIDNSAAAIYLKDDAGRYLLANRKHVDLWPVMKDFQPGMTPFDFYPEDTARSFLESDREVFASEKTKTFEEVITAANGKGAISPSNSRSVMARIAWSQSEVFRPTSQNSSRLGRRWPSVNGCSAASSRCRKMKNSFSVMSFMTG